MGVTCKAAPFACTYLETFRRKKERRVSRHCFAQHSCTVLELGSTPSMSLRRGTFYVHANRGFFEFLEPEQLKRTWGRVRLPGRLRDGGTSLDGLWEDFA